MLPTIFLPLATRHLPLLLVLAYAFAARIPVLIVMYVAMSANDGAASAYRLQSLPHTTCDMLPTLQVPQLSGWIGWTVAVGSIFGTVVAALSRRGKRAEQVAA